MKKTMLRIVIFLLIACGNTNLYSYIYTLHSKHKVDGNIYAISMINDREHPRFLVCTENCMFTVFDESKNGSEFQWNIDHTLHVRPEDVARNKQDVIAYNNKLLSSAKRVFSLLPEELESDSHYYLATKVKNIIATARYQNATSHIIVWQSFENVGWITQELSFENEQIHPQITALTINYDGNVIVAGTATGDVYIWITIDIPTQSPYTDPIFISGACSIM